MTAIAIDGPAGAGKSTVARSVAEALGFTYIDTGAMYRAIAFCAMEADIDPTDPDAADSLASRIELTLEGDRVLVDGRDVTGAIRTPTVTRASAEIAKHPGVRSALVRTQRSLASVTDVVMEGRDIGTEVLPDAELKIFLTASLDERAVRRGAEFGVEDVASLDELKTAISKRDNIDTSRAVSPLVQAPDAVVIDSTARSIEDIVAEVVALARALP